MLNTFYESLLSNKHSNLFYDGDTYISKEKFLTDVCSYCNSVKNDTNETIALYIPDNAYLFYVIFIALLCAQKNIILLSQVTENHLESLKEKTSSIITDQKITLENYHCYLPLADLDGEISLPKIDEINIYFYTSGSTSMPKCIKKTLSSLLLEVNMHSNIQKDLINQNPVILASIVPFHMYGVLWRLLFSLFNSLLQDLDTIFYPEEFIEKQSRHKKIMFISTPSFMNELVKHKDNYTYHKNIIGIFSSGSLLINELSNNINDILGVYPYEIYGSTETGGVAYRQQDKDVLWHVFPDVIIGAQSNSCLWVESKFSTSPLYNTSDIIEMLDEKTFILKERLDRMIKISEKRLSLPEMENYLNKWEYINSSYLLAEETEKRTILSAVITLTKSGKELIIKEGRSSFIMQMREYLAKEFDNSFIPRKTRIIEDIPTNAQGKIIKSEILSLLQSKVQEPLVLSSKSTSNRFDATFIFENNAEYFKGHFPDFPILPGVIQLHFAFHFLKTKFNIIPTKYSINKLKFTNLLLPNVEVDFTLEKRSDKEFGFTYSKNEKSYSSGIIKIED